jgi:galactitol-specific phosphotransferase system IIB component
MALGEIISFAATAGLNFAVGDTAGLNKLVDELPEGFKGPLMSVVDSVSELKNAVFGQDGVPTGGFTNPFGEIIDGFKSGLEGAGTNLSALSDLAAGSDPSITQYLTSAATSAGGFMKDTMDAMKSWTDEITLGVVTDPDATPFKLTDAFAAINNSSTKALELIGITQVPSLTDLCGTFVKDELRTNFESAFSKELVSRANLTDLMPVSPGEGQPPPPMSTEAQAAFEAWKVDFEEVQAAAAAINTQITTDKATVASLNKQNSALDIITTTSATMNSLDDPEHKALYASTLGTNLKDVTTKLAPLMTPTITVDTTT